MMVGNRSIVVGKPGKPKPRVRVRESTRVEEATDRLIAMCQDYPLVVQHDDGDDAWLLEEWAGKVVMLAREAARQSKLAEATSGEVRHREP